MKFLVIGLGSMGRRRIRLLKKISDSFEIIGVDAKVERCQQAESEFAISTETDLNEAIQKFAPDGAIVSTSPLSHAPIIETCLKAGLNVFTEINLVSNGYNGNIELAKKVGKTLFLSSTFLYREEICYIKEKVEKVSGKVNYIYHVGQYLPDWHPWEKINDYFVSDKRTNGCRELFAIELPWIVNTFGAINNISVLGSKNSQLPLSYNDNYQLLIDHKNGNKGLLAVDVITRKATRKLEVYSENMYLSWGGTPTTLSDYDIDKGKECLVELYDNIDSQKDYASFIIENAYESELRAFIDVLDNKVVAKYTFDDDLEIIKIIDKIENETIGG